MEVIEKLDATQQRGFDLIVSGSNVFITGPAGAGKSFLIEKAYTHLENTFGLFKVYKTSLTGVSASLINGRTLHSWAGIYLGEGTPEELVQDMKINIIQRWKRTRSLFIDEVSMLSPELLDKLDVIARIIRRNDVFFGGIQVIFFGDFFQLPVVKNKRFCFESICWKPNIEDNIVNLEIIHRQKDELFQKILCKIRKGEVDDEIIQTLSSRVGVELNNAYGIIPTVLYPKNDHVNELNNDKLKELLKTEKGYAFKASFTKYTENANNTEAINRLYEEFKKNQHIVDNTIILTKNTQIMFKKNITGTEIRNGTRGIIVEFVNEKIKMPDGTYKERIVPIAQLMNGNKFRILPETFEQKVKKEYKFIKKQLPIKLAWATSIHACQGASLDCVKADIGDNIFEYGQAYSALSRVRSLEGLFLISFDPCSIIANPKVIEFYKRIENR